MASADFYRVSRSLSATTVATAATPRQTSPDKSSHFPSTPAACTSLPCWRCRASPQGAGSPRQCGLIRGSRSSVQRFVSSFLPTAPRDAAVAFDSELPPPSLQRTLTS